MIINLDSQTDLSGFYVVYSGSVNLEKPGWYGLSHLLEHLLCKNLDHLQDTFEENGISWNAYTSNNEIVFHMNGLDENVNKYKYEFVKLLSEFNVTKEQFENERKIVLEEYMDTFNDQMSKHYLNLDRKLYGMYNPIGKRSDLEKLKFMDCLNFYEKQFMNPSKIINVSKYNKFEGNIKFDERVIDKEFEMNLDKSDLDLEMGNSFKDKSSLIIKSPIIKEDFYKIQFINLMLSSGLNSPFYKEIREKKGLVYFINCSLSRLNNVGYINISTLTSNENVSKVVDCVSEIFENPDKYLTKERFNIIKKSVDINLTMQDINRHSSVGRWISPDGWSLTKENIKDLTLEECIDVFNKHYDMDKFYISDDKSEFSK